MYQGKTLGGEQGLHGFGLVVAMLQQQPAARLQVRGRLGDDGADVFEAVCAAGQGLQGFVRQRGQVGVGTGDVGGVGDDRVKKTIHASQPITALKPRRQTQPLCVGLGHGQCIGTRVHRQYLGVSALALQRQRNGAAASAQVHHARRCQRGDHFQGPVHQGFGVGAWVQHAGVHLQRQAVELLASGEVGHRLARQAALAQGDELGMCCLFHRIRVVRQQPGAACVVARQGVQQQQLRVDARQSQGVGLVQCLGEGGGCVGHY
ncbi:hypothetical protein D3C71_1061670 [compost metagenome]